MQRINFVKYFLCFCLAGFICSAQAESSRDLSTLLNSVKTLRAHFTQIAYDNKGKVIQQSTGKMAIARPGKFRWDIQHPMPQLIIANGAKLWIYDPDLEQVTIRSLKKAAGESPALLLSQENGALERDFNVQELNESNSMQRFKLTPKKRENMYALIQLGFKNNILSEMELTDHLGHSSKIHFKQIESNVHLQDSLFTFNAPAKIDVIDETHKK